METILLNALAGNYRREVVNGREFIVAPLVSIVPGVLNGSKGALFYPEDEISRDPQAWNGMPLVKGHPTKNGQHISGRDPWVRANLQMGTIYNSVYDGRLQHEAWFDVEDTKRVDNWVYQQLINNRPIEVSTGLFTDNEPNRGTHNGRTYDYVARNYRPDHMAILVGQRGACSNKDGCGINVRNEAKSVWTKLGELLGLVSNEQVKCEECGYTMTDSEQEDGVCKNCGATLNAGVYGNPQSTATGKFKRHGAGTGKGDVHEAAQRGMMVLSDEDRQQGASAKAELEATGHNPASWVADEDKWEKAKAAADKGDYSEDEYWAVVSHIYKRMGGVVKEPATNANPEGCNQYKSCGEGGSDKGSISHGGEALRSATYEQVDAHVDGLSKPEATAAIKKLFGSDRRAKGASLSKMKETIREELYSKKGRMDKGEVIKDMVAKSAKGDDDVPLAELVGNSKQSDFIDCQEECDDMDCVDECLADFVGNNMPITLTEFVLNANPEGCNQYKSCGEGGGDSKESGRGKTPSVSEAASHSDAARAATMKTMQGDPSTRDKSHMDAAKEHDKARDSWTKIAEKRAKDGDKEGVKSALDLAMKHDKHATDHMDKAGKVIKGENDKLRKQITGNLLGDIMPTRNEAINQLVTNCDCWKGKQEVLANKDSFTDEDIQRLLKAFNARKLAVNTLREIGVATGAPATLTVNEMPAFIKAKMVAKEDEDQEVEDPTDEEEVVKPTKNAKKAPITERLSPEELEVWNNAVQITANEKKKIVGQLVANLQGDYRKAKAKKLMTKSMDDLREMLELRGTYNADQDDEPVTNGIGGFFLPDADDSLSTMRTDNADDDGPPLGLPRMDYASK